MQEISGKNQACSFLSVYCRFSVILFLKDNINSYMHSIKRLSADIKEIQLRPAMALNSHCNYVTHMPAVLKCYADKCKIIRLVLY
jgi:hypothetical protein